MNRWVYVILAVLLVPIQTTWLSAAGLHTVRPDLVLLFVYFTGFYAGEWAGILSGTALGLIMDFVSGGPMGLNIATEGIMGLLSGLLGRFFLNTTATLTMGMVLLLSVVNGIVVFSFHQWVMSGIPFIEVFRWIILPEALYNTLIGGIAFWAVVRRLDIKKPWADPASYSTSIV
jgi:rod shape-determining protein MreD